MSESLVDYRPTNDFQFLEGYASKFGLSFDRLSTLFFASNRSSNYREFLVKKSRGEGRRAIASPKADLKQLQQLILKDLSRFPSQSQSFAYETGKSAIACAQSHSKPIWAVKLDFKDFFHQITEPRLIRLFCALGFNKTAAKNLARVLTIDKPSTKEQEHLKEGRLPQGAPTSGLLANLICFEFDEAMFKFANSRGYVYTRYADDLLISSRGEYTRAAAEEVIAKVSETARDQRLVINKAKTRLYQPGVPIRYLGLINDERGLRLPRSFREQLRFDSRAIVRFGLEASENYHLENSRNYSYKNKRGRKTLRSYLLTRHIGQLTYAKSLDFPGAEAYFEGIMLALSREWEFFEKFYGDEVKNWILANLPYTGEQSHNPKQA